MKEKIKELFMALPRAEQLELIRELTSSADIRNPVVEASSISQEQFGQNISFKVNNIGDGNNPKIEVEMFTPWGTFTAEGVNQKIAKAKVAEIAIATLEGSIGANEPPQHSDNEMG